MKVFTIVGARPQFVKAAAVSRVLRQRHTEILVHTGQHYDDALSGVFFRQLGLPEPEIHLGVGSGSHAEQTARMLVPLEQAMLDARPDWVLVYGDTNSTLAGALAAAKIQVPLAHVEAGLRSFNRAMPEEHNRVVTDHLADLLLAPTGTAMRNLAIEALSSRALLVGDVMVDILRLSLPLAGWQGWLREQSGLKLETRQFGVLTIHRAANTDDSVRLAQLLAGIGRLDFPVVFPVHPRTRKAMEHARISVPHSVLLCDPAPYLVLLGLMRDARIVLTDSGGVQKEAYVLAVPCVTLRAETEWIETLEDGWNVLVDVDQAAMLAAAHRPRPAQAPRAVFGSGHAAEAVVAALEANPGTGPDRRKLD